MYSEERRTLILRAFTDQSVQSPPPSVRQLARLFNVSKSTAHRWIQMGSQAGVDNNLTSNTPKPPTKLETILQYIDQEIMKDPFQTCARLKNFLKTDHNIVVSLELIRLGIKKLGYTKKVARYYGVAKNALALNVKFLKKRDEYIKNGAKIFSIDETGFGRFSYKRRSGYSKSGEPLMIRKEKARVTSTSVLACASANGWVARTTIKGGVNRQMFCDFILSLDLPEGSVFLLDNASIHKGDIIFDAFKQKQFIPLYVPPYSPWYNPIEKCFSIVKYIFYEKQNIEKSFDHLTREDHFIPYFRHVLHCYGMNDSDARKNIETINSAQAFDDETSNETNKKSRKPVVKKSEPTETQTKSRTKIVDADGRIVQTTTVVTTVVTTRAYYPKKAKNKTKRDEHSIEE